MKKRKKMPKVPKRKKMPPMGSRISKKAKVPKRKKMGKTKPVSWAKR